MVDPTGGLGLAVGIPPLLIFAIEIGRLIHDTKTYDRTFTLVNTKLENERFLLQLWAKDVGFGTSCGYDKRLTDRRIAPRIQENLQRITEVFGDAKEIVDRYSNNIEKKDGYNGRQIEDGLRSTRAKFRGWRRKQRKAIRWATKDKERLETLITNLSDLIEALSKMTEVFWAMLEAEELERKRLILKSRHLKAFLMSLRRPLKTYRERRGRRLALKQADAKKVGYGMELISAAKQVMMAPL